MDQTEKHFQIMIYLMLTFFCIYVGLSMLQGMKVFAGVEAISTAIVSSHDSFEVLFGIAVGMFHGMLPQGSLGSQTIGSQKVTTDVTVHSEKDPIK